MLSMYYEKKSKSSKIYYQLIKVLNNSIKLKCI